MVRTGTKSGPTLEVYWHAKLGLTPLLFRHTIKRRKAKWRLVKIFALIVLLIIPSAVQADTKTITSDASYIMGDGETPGFAEERTLQKAKQAALEEAGTYVQSYTKVQNLNLTTDEIQTIAGGILQIEVLEKTRTLLSDGLRFYTKIRASVSTEKMEELARRIKGRDVAEEYTKLQEDYARLNDELEDLKRLVAKTPEGPEREAALDQIRARAKEFSHTHKMETALVQRLVLGQNLAAVVDRERATIDRLVEEIRERGHRVKIGETKAFLLPQGESRKDQNLAPMKPRQRGIQNKQKSDDPIDTLIKFPITIEAMSSLPDMVRDAASTLGSGYTTRWEEEVFDVFITNSDSFLDLLVGQHVPETGPRRPNRKWESKLEQWENAYELKLGEYRRAGKDTSGLRTPGNPDYIGEPPLTVEKDEFLEYVRQRYSEHYVKKYDVNALLRSNGIRFVLSNQRYLNEYFYSRLRNTAAHVRLEFLDREPFNCFVSPLLASRLLPIHKQKSVAFYSFSRTNQEASEALLLKSPISLVIEHRLSGLKLRQLVNVTMTFVDRTKNSIRDCSVTVDDSPQSN